VGAAAIHRALRRGARSGRARRGAALPGHVHGIDAEHAAGAGKWLAEAIELGNARRERETGQTARKAADEAAAACLKRATEIQLAVLQLGERMPADPDFSTGPRLSSAEVTHGLMAAMGLADPMPRRHEEALPPVGDLARQIGLRS
jgi:hypothetical protein